MNLDFDDAPPSGTIPRAHPSDYERPEDMPPPDDAPEPSRAIVTAPAFRPPLTPVGRSMPHSLEAEEYLLSCCFLDGADVVSRCLDAKLSPGSFYDTKHAIIFERLLDLFRRQAPIDIGVVAEELKSARQLDQVGGYAFLSQVSGRIPTTAQAGYFIEKVREQALLREMIRSATAAVEDCYNFSGGIADFAAEFEARVLATTRRAQGSTTWVARSLADFALPPADDPGLLLGKYRYLCRGGGLVLVGSSGTGKSSASIQAAVCWALGRDFLGITCPRPLRSLIVQAEDDEGDVAEVWVSIAAAMKLSPEEVEIVRSRVLIVEDRVTSGAEFLNELKGGAARWKPDLVFINPLLSFAGCAIAEQEKMSAFLRNGLNRVNADKRWGYVLVHHTNKPPTAKDAAARNWNEYMYNMAGSAELPNWARAVITIEAKKEEGQFLFRLAKRGKRAGVTRELPADPEQGEGSYRVEIVTKIHAQHSSRRIKLTDGRTLQMMVWEAGEESAEESSTQESKAQRSEQVPAGRKPKNTFEDFADLWPRGEENALPFGELKRRLSVKDSLSDGALSRLVKQAMADGRLKFRLSDNKKKAGYFAPA